MKLNPNKDNIYAFSIGSIESINNKKKPDLTFKALTGNFYTDLINSDLTIRRNKKLLSHIKNRSIKESIYSNRDIPKSWKTILGYQNEVYKAIDQDPNFAYYLGATNNKDNKVNEFFGTKLKNIDNSNKTERNKKFISLENIDKYIKDNNIDNKDLSNNITNNNSKDKSREKNNNEIKVYNKTISFSEKSNSIKIPHHQWSISNEINKKLNDKFLSSKLDEYRTKYDIDKFTEKVKHAIKEIKIDYDDDIFIERAKRNRNRNYYREYLKSKTQNKKRNVLKKAIFSNLIQEKGEERQFYRTLYDNNNAIGTHRFVRNKKYTPFKTISSFGNKENRFENVEMNNKIKRDLELINFFGPHYSNCLVCKKRNMDFYANSEPNQAMILLNYLKKIKFNGKSNKHSKSNKE